ncbi:MAG TPA: sulfatase-like hydrolase/transferase [Microvirga sp.]|jgi:hypothetical protein
MVRDRAALILSLSAGTLASAVVFLALPTTLFEGNRAEFKRDLLDIVLTFALPALILILSAILPALMLPRRLSIWWASAMAATALYLWAYGSFVVYDFGLLDGQAFVIAASKAQMIAEVVCIAVLVVATLFVARTKPELTAGLLAVLTAGNIAVAATPLLNRDTERPAVKRYDELYQFSKEKNVLVILLDAMQSDIFDEIVASDEALRETLTGFTFFTDTAGVAPTTFLSMPAIHSGLEYDRVTAIPAYSREAIEQQSFLNQLARNGYVTTLINPIGGLCPRDIKLCVDDTDVLGGSSMALRQNATTLLDLTLLRVAPLALKPAVYNKGQWTISRLVQEPVLAHFVLRGNALLMDLARNMTTVQVPTAKFLHLFGTHLPIVLDDQCVYRAEKITHSRDAYKAQVACSLAALRTLLTTMKQQGFYDNSAIVIMADHGTANMPHARAVNAASRPINARKIGQASPTFAVKPYNATQAFSRSDDPISIADAGAILCGMIKDCHVERPGPNRPRTFNNYTYSRKILGKDFVPDLIGYEITGPLVDGNNWRPLPATQ